MHDQSREKQQNEYYTNDDQSGRAQLRWPFLPLAVLQQRGRFHSRHFSSQLQTTVCTKSFPPSLSPISLLRSSKHQLFMKNRFWQLESNGRIHLHIPMSKSSSAIGFEMKGIPKLEPRVWGSTLGFATEYGASEAESWQHNWKTLITLAFNLVSASSY